MDGIGPFDGCAEHSDRFLDTFGPDIGDDEVSTLFTKTTGDAPSNRSKPLNRDPQTGEAIFAKAVLDDG